MAVASTSNPKTLSPFDVFRNGNFVKLWTGELISTMGSALTSLASSILIYRITGSAMSVGLMLMATAAPSLLVGLLAGVLVDRFDRQKIMIASDLIRAVLVFLIPFLVPHSIIWLYVIVMLSSAVGQFFDPAHESVLPEIASEEELSAANSLMAISSFGATAVGFAASGLIASAANINWAFYLDAFSFLVSVLCICLLHVKQIKIEEETSITILFKNLKIGVNQLFDIPILKSLFSAQIPILISCGLMNSLLLPFALKALKATEFEYGIQEGLTSLGFVVGSLLMAKLFDRMQEGSWMALSYFGMGLAAVIYSQLHSIPLAFIVLTISGFSNAPSTIARRLVIQRNTPREKRGRINSIFFVSRDILFLVGMGAAGLADYLNIRYVYLLSAILLLLGAVLVMVMPGLRREQAVWRQALALLRAAPAIPALRTATMASMVDFDTLAGLLPVLSDLTLDERKSLVSQAQVLTAPAGSVIVKHGETDDAAYFILAGRAVAGISLGENNYRSLSVMNAGDFFGEIAALTGVARTADVVAEENTSLFRIPGKALHPLMAHPRLQNLFFSKMAERLTRTSINELPRFAGVDQQDSRELRTAPTAAQDTSL